jgi:hypothetical protein
MEKKRIIIFLFIITFFGCKSEISNCNINKPTIKSTKKQLRNNPYLKDDKIYIESEKYLLSRRIEIRNKILDSLNILKDYTKLIIVDHFWDSNGRQLEANYFSFSNKLLEVKYEYENPEKHYIKEIPLDKSKHINKIINYFNKDNLNDINGEIDLKSFVFYNVTVLINKQVGYYEITTDSIGNKINRLE